MNNLNSPAKFNLPDCFEPCFIQFLIQVILEFSFIIFIH